jgi:HEAT repeat protein
MTTRERSPSGRSFSPRRDAPGTIVYVDGPGEPPRYPIALEGADRPHSDQGDRVPMTSWSAIVRGSLLLVVAVFVAGSGPAALALGADEVAARGHPDSPDPNATEPYDKALGELTRSMAEADASDLSARYGTTEPCPAKWVALIAADGEDSSHACAALSIRHCTERSDEVVALLRHPHAKVRVMAARLLGAIGDPNAARALKEIVCDPDDDLASTRRSASGSPSTLPMSAFCWLGNQRSHASSSRSSAAAKSPWMKRFASG